MAKSRREQGIQPQWLQLLRLNGFSEFVAGVSCKLAIAMVDATDLPPKAVSEEVRLAPEKARWLGQVP